METPEFLVWAIGYRCPIRGFQDGSDPEHTERQLRAARAVSDAQREKRVFEGLCVDPPNAFRIDDALSIYGGLAVVEQNCRACPANASPGTLAGCFGIFPLYHADETHRAIKSAIDRLGLAADYARLFAVTQPRWYGLWVQSPLQPYQLDFLHTLLNGLDDIWGELKFGVQVAVERKMAFHATLYPHGRVEGLWWRLAPHCPRCKAARHVADSPPCAVCKFVGGYPPEKKRRARGKRPYISLDRLLGSGAADFLARYRDFQAQPVPPASAENPPLPTLPDSPPAG